MTILNKLKRCEVCKYSFIVNRITQKYCSVKCRKKNENNQPNIIKAKRRWDKENKIKKSQYYFKNKEKINEDRKKRLNENPNIKEKYYANSRKWNAQKYLDPDYKLLKLENDKVRRLLGLKKPPKRKIPYHETKENYKLYYDNNKKYICLQQVLYRRLEIYLPMKMLREDYGSLNDLNKKLRKELKDD